MWFGDKLSAAQTRQYEGPVRVQTARNFVLLSPWQVKASRQADISLLAAMKHLLGIIVYNPMSLLVDRPEEVSMAMRKTDIICLPSTRERMQGCRHSMLLQTL